MEMQISQSDLDGNANKARVTWVEMQIRAQPLHVPPLICKGGSCFAKPLSGWLCKGWLLCLCMMALAVFGILLAFLAKSTIPQYH